MVCSGGHNCKCTGFHVKKSSRKCKACSHPLDDHDESSDDNSSKGSNSDGGDDSNDDSGHGHGGKLPSSTKNKRTVSALIANLIDGGEYTGTEVKNAKDKAKAGLMRKRVSLILGLRSVMELTTLLPRVVRRNQRPTLSAPAALGCRRLRVNWLMGKGQGFGE